MVWELLIPGIAVGLSLLAIGIELLMHDREKAQKIEFAIQRKQREVKKYQKEKNAKAMMDTQKELMGLMGQNMRMKSKMMFISFPLFIVIFWLLSGMLNVGPLYANSNSHIGADIRNLVSSQHQNLKVELVSPGLTITGTNAVSLELNDNGDSGDHKQVWWNVTAPEGDKQYSVKVTSANKSDEKQYSVKFVPGGALTAGFSPQGASNLLNGSVSVAPIYSPVDINLGFMTLGWYWYYFFLFLIMGILLSPLKNQLLWGHYKGVKHLEKLDNNKNKGVE